MKIKKMLIGFVGSLALATAFSACGGDEPTTFRVTFVQEGQKSVFYTVEKGKALTKIPDPVPVKGYSVAWDLNGINLSNITENITVTSVATANDYTITYDTKGGVLGSYTQTVKYDSEYKLAFPAHDVYPFDCWTYNGEAFENEGIWKIDSNVTLVAEWEEVYNVTFKQFGQPDVVKTVVKGEKLTDIPDVKPREGYKVEWSAFDPNSITQDTVVTAVETANTYTINYNAGEGTISSATQNVIYDGAYELLTPTRSGYTFVCWKNNGVSVAQKADAWKIAQDNITLVAEWEEVKVETCTVTFVQEGQPNVVKTVEKGQDLTDIPVPAPKKGYNLAWNLEGVSLTNIQTNLVITLKETAKEYTLTYQVGGEKYDETTVIFGKAFTLLETVDVTGYDLVKWQKDGEDFIGGVWSMDSNVTLDAVLKGKSYFISYMVNGVQHGEPQKVTFGESFALANDVSVTGYEFVEWQKNGVAFDSETWNIAENVVLHAKLKAKEYKITYMVEGAQYGEPQTVVFDKAYELPTVITLNGQQYFVEWYKDDVKFASGVWTMESDLSLTGQIMLLSDKVFTVTLQVKTSCCKLTTTTIQVKYGQSTEALLKPVCGHDEHSFKYWTYNGEQISDTWDIVSDGEIVLVAKMKRNWTNNH